MPPHQRLIGIRYANLRTTELFTRRGIVFLHPASAHDHNGKFHARHYFQLFADHQSAEVLVVPFSGHARQKLPAAQPTSWVSSPRITSSFVRTPETNKMECSNPSIAGIATRISSCPVSTIGT